MLYWLLKTPRFRQKDKLLKKVKKTYTNKPIPLLPIILLLQTISASL